MVSSSEIKLKKSSLIDSLAKGQINPPKQIKKIKKSNPGSECQPLMGLTIYQSITPAERPQEQEPNGSLCGSTGSRQYQIKKWCGIRRSTWLIVLYIIAYFSFLIGGCFLFSSLEKDNESFIKEGIEGIKQDFLYQHPDVSTDELEQLIKGITYRGISPLRQEFNSSNWSFGQSFLFTVTVVTTIGYGHINPVTSSGKLTCILYALLGIPFTLVFLSAVVQRLLSPTFKLLTKLMAKLPNIDGFQVRMMHLAVLSAVFIISAFLIPSVVFSCIEPSWDLLDSMYFVFISLTTIGLGDYIPGDSDTHNPYRDLYKTMVGVYLLLGLVLLSLTLTVYYDIPQLNLGLHLHRHRDIFDEGEVRRSSVNGRDHKDSELSNHTTVSSYMEEGETNDLVRK